MPFRTETIKFDDLTSYLIDHEIDSLNKSTA